MSAQILDDERKVSSNLPSLYISRISESKFHLILAIAFLILIVILLNHNSDSVQDILKLAFRTKYHNVNSYARCSHHTCFNVRPCVYEYPDEIRNQIRIFVYPEMYLIDEEQNYIAYKGGIPFKNVLFALNTSKYAVHDPSKACLFVISMDFSGNFNQNSSSLQNVVTSFPW